MEILHQVATTMQTVMTQTANQVAQQTGLIKRQRKFTGASFAQSLVFGWLSNPEATLEELAQTAASIGVAVTPEAMFQRFTPDAASFLGQLLDCSIDAMIRADAVAIDLLQRFEGVYLLDSSIVVLPDELADVWHGCGGQKKNTAASVKLSVCWEMIGGHFQLHLESGRTQDKASPLATQSLPSGALRIADLGYFSLTRLAELNQDGTYWLTRVKVQCMLYPDAPENQTPTHLLDFLVSQNTDRVEGSIRLGAKAKIACRLLAVRVPQAVADARRRQLRARLKRKGQTPSQQQLMMADWTVLVTNVPPAQLSLEEALVLMRLRWQIELLFKLWKHQGKIDKSRSEQPWRILCEMYAKLIGQIIAHWLLLTGSWRHPGRSFVKGAKTIRRHAMHIACAVAGGIFQSVIDVCQVIANCLATGCRLNRRKKEPNTYQRLLALQQTP